MSKPFATESRRFPHSVAVREESIALSDDARLVREDADRHARCLRVRGDRTGMHQGLDLRHEAHCDEGQAPPQTESERAAYLADVAAFAC